MATPFPLDDYPVLQGVSHTDRSRALRDVADDGAPHVRIVSDNQYRTIQLKFAPLNSITSRALVDYLTAESGTEFEIEIQSGTYTGYLWSDAKVEHKDALYWVSVDFYGRLN